MKNIKTILKMTSLGLVGVLTVACLGDEVTRASIDKKSQVQVLHVSFDHLVAVDASSGGIGGAGMKRLDGFLRGLSPKFGDKIEIIGGSESDRADVFKHLKPLMLSMYETANTTGALKVVIHRAIVRIPNCGDWSYEENPMNDNDTNRNFGCSNDTNLARMLADPSDLVEGKTPGLAKVGADLISVQEYRAGKLEMSTESSSSTSELTGG